MTVGVGLGGVTARQNCDESRPFGSDRLLIRPAGGGPGRHRHQRQTAQVQDNLGQMSVSLRVMPRCRSPDPDSDPPGPPSPATLTVPLPARPVRLQQAAARGGTAGQVLHPRPGHRHRPVDRRPVGRRLHPGGVWPFAADGQALGAGRLGRVRLLRLHLVTTVHGLPVAFALANPKADEREVLVDLFDVEPGLLAARRGQRLLLDKGYRDAETEAILAARGVVVLRPAYQRETPRPAASLFKALRQRIESVNDTLKGQLDLERHGGRTIEGVTVRVLQRLLALTAAIWHNHKTGQPVIRSLVAYDHS